MQLKMIMARVLVGTWLVWAVNTFGQTKSVSKEEMIQDIDTLFSTIGKIHPDMYAVYPKKKLDKEIEKVKSKLEPSGDIFYFYKEITPLVVKLGDGHTNIPPPWYPKLLRNADIRFFPFSVMVTYPDKVIRVQNDYTQNHNAIPIGAQITSINKRQASDIVKDMMHYTSGEKEFFKIDRLRKLFTPLLYMLYRNSIFDIDYVFNRERHSIQVKGTSVKEMMRNASYQNMIINASYQNNLNSASLNKYAFKTLSDKNIGIIELNEFTDMDRFKVFLDSTFHVLQKEAIKNLIIDIRENSGGDSKLGDELFQYISPVPFAQFSKVIVKYSDVQKQFYKTNYNYEITNPNGIEIYNENTQLIEPKENDLRYRGKVFLLISHSTFSSAASFSWTFKYFKMGSVVGEETGGMDVCFGDVIWQQLPNSELTYSISHKKFYQYAATDDNIHGTLPDYNVEAGKALQFTIDLITKIQREQCDLHITNIIEKPAW